MKALLLQGIVYILPGFIVLAAFIGGHAAVGPRAEHLQPYRDRFEATAPADTDAPAAEATAAPAEGEAPAQGEAVPAGAEATATGEERVQVDEQGQIIPPSYRYFSFASAFAGNARDGSGLFSLELSVSVFLPPMFSDGVILRLQEREAVVRGLIMDTLADVAAEDLRTVEARRALTERIRTLLNDWLVSEGLEPDIEEVIITSFVLT
jgi:flagellar basal body-associated protein FliL